MKLFDTNLLKVRKHRSAPNNTSQQFSEFLGEDLIDRISVLNWNVNGCKINSPYDISLPYPKNDNPNLFVDSMNLHFENDPLGFLKNYKKQMQPGDFFICNFLGGNSLSELRAALYKVDQELNGGISPRIIPMIDVKDAGRLMQEAGFSMPISDSEILEYQFENLYSLFNDLRDLNLNNCLYNRNKIFPKKNFFTTLQQAANLNTVTADIITISGIA